MKLITIILPSDRKDRNENGIKYSIPNCATAVLMITDDDKKILFDTGAFGYDKVLINNLKKQGLTPEDIDYVILSHAHFDHNANLYLFRNAKLVYAKWLVSLKNGDTQSFGKPYDGIPQIEAKGIRIIKTPGHTEDSISVVCDYQGKTYAIVGDALKVSIIKKGTIKNYSNPVVYLENMKKLANMADVIIAGDDGMITGEALQEVRKLLDNTRI